MLHAEPVSAQATRFTCAVQSAVCSGCRSGVAGGLEQRSGMCSGLRVLLLLMCRLGCGLGPEVRVVQLRVVGHAEGLLHEEKHVFGAKAAQVQQGCRRVEGGDEAEEAWGCGPQQGVGQAVGLAGSGRVQGHVKGHA